MSRRDSALLFAGMFLVTFMVAIAAVGGFNPLRWLEDRRSDPLTGAIRVVDGDTIAVDGEKIRISNIDTPEMPPRAQCAAEAAMARRAKTRLEVLIRNRQVATFIPDLNRERDAYGRLLGRVVIDGQDVGEYQVAAGLAQRWTGSKAEWC